MRIHQAVLSGVSTLLVLSRVAVGDATPSAPVLATTCNVERAGTDAFPEGPLLLREDTSTDLSGWVVDLAHGEVPFELWVSLTSSEGRRLDLPVRHRVFRSDIVAHFKNDKLMLAGFAVKATARALGPGTWKILLRYRSKHVDYVCDSGRAVVVRSEGH